MRASETMEDDLLRGVPGDPDAAPEPGVLLVFSGERPALEILPLQDGVLDIGRGVVAGVLLDDRRLSRENTRITFDGHRFLASDRGSRNGTAVDGEDLHGSRARPVERVVRAGGSLFLPVLDARPFRAGVACSRDAVIGPRLQHALDGIARLARSAPVLHITGESGSGKEMAARAFHTAGPRAGGPFVAVNAATLKPELAEALLFGSRKGFYTGAPGGPGYVQEAHGGTLFLDEIADLDPSVQAKLLRVLQEKQVVKLGETRPEPVDFRLCTATHADLRDLVAAGKLREDLYYRIGSPAVVLPPLRERAEEIPWLVERAVRRAAGAPEGAVRVHVQFVEACLLRPWPGNVRELLAEAGAAAQWAAGDGGLLLARHLAARAGTAIAPAAPASPPAARAPSRSGPSDEAIDEALAASGHKIAVAARALGMHRTQLYRRMEQRKRGQ